MSLAIKYERVIGMWTGNIGEQDQIMDGARIAALFASHLVRNWVGAVLYAQRSSLGVCALHGEMWPCLMCLPTGCTTVSCGNHVYGVDSGRSHAKS